MAMSMSEMKQLSITGDCCSSGDDGDGDGSGDGDCDGDKLKEAYLCCCTTIAHLFKG